LIPAAGTVTVVLVLFAAMLPVSNELSFATMRCTVPSPFCQATVSGAPGYTGFGLKDWLPRSPTMLTVAEGGVGVGVGDGLGLPP
jgi:hypothetical protein